MRRSVIIVLSIGSLLEGIAFIYLGIDNNHLLLKIKQDEKTMNDQNCIIQTMEETYQTMLKNEDIMQSTIDRKEKEIQSFESSQGDNMIWVTPPQTFKDMENNQKGEVK